MTTNCPVLVDGLDIPQIAHQLVDHLGEERATELVAELRERLWTLRQLRDMASRSRRDAEANR